MSNTSIVTLVEMTLGVTATGSISHLRQFFDLAGGGSGSSSAAMRVFSSKAHVRHRQLRGAWISQLEPSDMPGRAVPVVHTTDQTLVLKGISNVIGYTENENGQSSGWSSASSGLDCSSMIKLLNPPNILLEEGYYTVTNSYGPSGDSWLCTSSTGPCPDYLRHGSLGYGYVHVLSSSLRLPSIACHLSPAR